MGWVNLEYIYELRRLILFVVAVPPIAYDVHKDIFMELFSEFECHLHSLVHHLWFIGVDVNDRSLDRLCHVCAIKTGSGLGRCSCESNLVICDDVNDSVRLVVIQVAHLETLVNYALPCNCSISVNEDPQCFA